MPVDAAHPLPVSATIVAASSTPLAGSAVTSELAGPFTPGLADPVWHLVGERGRNAIYRRRNDGAFTDCRRRSMEPACRFTATTTADIDFHVQVNNNGTAAAAEFGEVEVVNLTKLRER